MPRLSLASLLIVCALSSASPAAAEHVAPSLLPALKLSVSELTLPEAMLPLARDGYGDTTDPRPSSGTPVA